MILSLHSSSVRLNYRELFDINFVFVYWKATIICCLQLSTIIFVVLDCLLAIIERVRGSWECISACIAGSDALQRAHLTQQNLISH